MDKLQILHEIVSTDNIAKAIQNEAQKLKDGYAEDLERQIGWIETNCKNKAQEAIAAHEQKEIAAADAAIAQIDAEHEQSLRRARRFMEENSEAVSRMIWAKVVGHDD